MADELTLYDPDSLTEERCPHCGALLYRAKLPPGSVVEIVCHGCKGLRRRGKLPRHGKVTGPLPTSDVRALVIPA
jgi:hypothetical protein